MNELPCITMDFWTSKYKWPAMNMMSTNNADFIGYKDYRNTIFKKKKEEVH